MIRASANALVINTRGNPTSLPRYPGVSVVIAGIKAAAFPTMVAGDDDRAAFAVFGSTTAGSAEDRAFAGLWHLYVATTYDGGNSLAYL